MTNTRLTAFAAVVIAFAAFALAGASGTVHQAATFNINEVNGAVVYNVSTTPNVVVTTLNVTQVPPAPQGFIDLYAFELTNEALLPQNSQVRPYSAVQPQNVTITARIACAADASRYYVPFQMSGVTGQWMPINPYSYNVSTCLLGFNASGADSIMAIMYVNLPPPQKPTQSTILQPTVQQPAPQGAQQSADNAVRPTSYNIMGILVVAIAGLIGGFMLLPKKGGRTASAPQAPQSPGREAYDVEVTKPARKAYAKKQSRQRRGSSGASRSPGKGRRKA